MFKIQATQRQLQNIDDKTREEAAGLIPITFGGITNRLDSDQDPQNIEGELGLKVRELNIYLIGQFGLLNEDGTPNTENVNDITGLLEEAKFNLDEYDRKSELKDKQINRVNQFNADIDKIIDFVDKDAKQKPIGKALENISSELSLEYVDKEKILELVDKLDETYGKSQEEKKENINRYMNNQKQGSNIEI